jgi:hypothetical protein
MRLGVVVGVESGGEPEASKRMRLTGLMQEEAAWPAQAAES